MGKETVTIIVGKRGIITIPAKFREQLGINEGEPLKVTIDGKVMTIQLIETRN